MIDKDDVLPVHWGAEKRMNFLKLGTNISWSQTSSSCPF